MTWTLQEQPLPASVMERYRSKKVTVFAHFHEDDWPMIAFYFHRPMIVLVSLSKDGSLLSLFLKRVGFKVARGSSSRGAVRGFKALVDLCHLGDVYSVSLAVDGPRGPRRGMKRGVLRLAHLMESPVVFAVAQVDRAWIANSWARTVIPKPFATLSLKYVELLSVDEVNHAVLAHEESKALDLMQERLAKHLN